MECDNVTHGVGCRCDILEPEVKTDCQHGTIISGLNGYWECKHCGKLMNSKDMKSTCNNKPIDKLTLTQQLIVHECEVLRDDLLDKNRKYGDSAINPVRIVSKADPIEQIKIRQDDKLSRMMSGQCDDDEDPERDFVGYHMLKRVAVRVQAMKDE